MKHTQWSTVDILIIERFMNWRSPGWSRTVYLTVIWHLTVAIITVIIADCEMKNMLKINNLPDDPYVNKAYDTADQI